MRDDPRGRPRVLVTGSAGGLGDGVARHLRARGRFAVGRLLVVPGGLDGLRAAMTGCYGVVGTTGGDGEDAEREHAEGMDLVDAAADAGVGHLVLCTRGPAGMARVEAYARRLGIPATFVHLAGSGDDVDATADRAGRILAEVFERRKEMVGRIVVVGGGGGLRTEE